MKYRYVTIEREYGSGATEIAGALAQRCGMACYGKEILEEIAQKYHISIDKLEQYEESVTNSFMYTVYAMSKVQAGDPDLTSLEGSLFVIEQQLIQKYAQQGPSVFLGHCASAALEERQDVLNIFIGADMDFRRKRSMAEYGLSEYEVDSKIKRFDKKRAHYYTVNTSKKWKDSDNYDLVLDSGKLGIDGCVAALEGLLKL